MCHFFTLCITMMYHAVVTEHVYIFLHLVMFDLQGSEENFRSLVSLTERARDQYREMIHQIEREIADHPPRVTAPGVSIDFH